MVKKLNVFCLFFLLMSCFCWAANPPEAKNKPKTQEKPILVQEELEGLDHLILATKHTLQEQIHIKEMILDYLKEQSLYLEHPESKEQLIKTSRSARKALEAIREKNMAQAFEAKFIAELTLFAKIAKKPAIPKPQI